MAPPLVRAFTVDHLASLDEQALRDFVAPVADLPGGARRLGTALSGQAHHGLAARVAAVLDPDRGDELLCACAAGPGTVSADVARRSLVDLLFWPLLYWHLPAVYDQLIAGEDLHPGILAELELDGADVADLGCGTGRFTLLAAPRARSVVAVDAAPPLLDRLSRRLERGGVTNVAVRRGGFRHLPIASASVDVAVACSSLGARPPVGGDSELAEMLRILRPGGLCAVIWPDEVSWFTARGMTHLVLPGLQMRRFRDVDSARRLCRLFYGEAAAAWVVRRGSAEVPYAILGMRPPADLCLMRSAAPPHPLSATTYSM